MEIPTRQLREELLAIKGVGEETADSIILYAVGRPLFVVDAYTRVILSRIGMIPEKIGYRQLQELFHNNLPPDVPLFKDFHAQFVELGKRHCRKTPVCGGCPVVGECETGRLNAKS